MKFKFQCSYMKFYGNKATVIWVGLWLPLAIAAELRNCERDI